MESAKEAEVRQKKNQEHMRDIRIKETAEEAELRKKKDQEQKKKMREKETAKEVELRNKNNQQQMKSKRAMETPDQSALRKSKDLKQKTKKQSNNSEYQRLQNFRRSVRYGPIFTCTVCEQDLFEHSVKALNVELMEIVQETCPEVFFLVFSDPQVV